jgi:Bacterial SH3 domain
MRTKLSLTAAALALTVTIADADMLFTIPTSVSEGHMNVRSGPGANHGLIGAIPGGQTVSASRCVPRDDGIRGADWCLVTWNGMRGWVSQAGLMPVPMVRAAPPPGTPPPVSTTDRLQPTCRSMAIAVLGTTTPGSMRLEHQLDGRGNPHQIFHPVRHHFGATVQDQLAHPEGHRHLG